MSDKSVQQDPFKILRIFNKNVAQECPASVSDQSVKKAGFFQECQKECQARMSHKDVSQECLARVSYKSFTKMGAFRFVGSIRFFHTKKTTKRGTLLQISSVTLLKPSGPVPPFRRQPRTFRFGLIKSSSCPWRFHRRLKRTTCFLNVGILLEFCVAFKVWTYSHISSYPMVP